MRKSNSYLFNKVKNVLFYKEGLLYCSLILVFSSLFALKQLVTHVTQGSAYPIHSDVSFSQNKHQPTQLPLQSDQIPEIPDEVESTDNFDDNPNKIFWILPASHASNLCSGRSLLSHLKHSIESRSEISLFVLHHSWKSFLI